MPKTRLQYYTMREVLVIFCLVGVFSKGIYTVKAADYSKYDGKISPIGLPIEIRYRPIVASPQEGDVFLLMELGRKKTEIKFKSVALVESKKKDGHLILSFKIDPDKSRLTINGEDAGDKLKTRKGLKGYFEITDTGKLLKSNNKFGANSLGIIAPKLTTSVIKKPNQLISETSWSMVTSKKIPTNGLFKAFAAGMSEYKDRKVLVTKVIGKMDIGGQFSIPLQGYQLLDITTGYILEMKLSGAFRLQIKNQTIALGMKLNSRLDAPVSSFQSLRSTTASSAKQKQQSNSVQTLTLEKAKNECSQLGFKKGTEKHGECVLQLHK